MMDSSSILGAIQHYQRNIERSQSQSDETRLLHCINKLYKLPVKVEHLQETGIGKTVNSLRKFNGEIGIAAKALVTKWKAMVAAEEEKEPSAPTNRQSNEADNSVNGENYSSDDRLQRSRSSSRDMSPKPPEQPAAGERKSSSSSSAQKQRSGEHESATTARQRPTQDDRKRETKEHHNKRRSGERECKAEQSQRSKDKHSHHNAQQPASSEGHQSRRHKTQLGDRQGEKRKSPSLATHHKSSTSSRREGERHSSKHRHHSSKEQTSNQQSEKDTAKSKKRSASTVITKDSGKHGRTDDVSHQPDGRAKSKSTAASSSSTTERKRRHNSGNETTGDAKSPAAKTASVQKTTKKEPAEQAVEPEDGIDSSMGTNFADVLGMLNMPAKKSKKSATSLSTSTLSAGSSTSARATKDCASSSTTSKINSHTNGMKSAASIVATTSYPVHRSPSAKPELLSSSAKLAPLDPCIALELPTISNNYKPMPLNQTVMDCVFNTSSSSASKAPGRTLTDAEALSHGISSKTMRTKIYSGVKTGQILQVPSLFDLCIRVLQKNIDALEYTGGVPFEVLRAVLERATPHQLLIFEEYNPYLMEDSDVLWQQHVARNYRGQKRQEMETWREMFLRCQDDQERKLNILAESIKQSQKIIAAPVRKTQLAFVDSMVKPPRNVQRKQEQFGTKGKMIATPAARVAALSSVTPNAAKPGDVRLRVAAGVRDAAQVSSAGMRPKKAPLMAKTLQLMKGRHKR